ncbi:MAG: hypothetical protein HUK19_02760 [Fibrobacter sp.]|nr:hypothetical protein [Fibrobacter sp.]
MKINKIAFLLIAGSLVSTAAFAGVHHNRPAPPPPRGELHERICDGGNCCNLDVDGRTLDYTLRCDHEFKDAELRVGDRRPEIVYLNHRGRLRNEIRPGERLSIKLTYPPRREIHTRLCDRDNCCQLDVDGRSRNYHFRCDHPYARAELTVNNRMTFDLRDHGHMDRDVFEGDRLQIRLSYPPPPPPPSHKPARVKAREDERRRR